MNVTFSISSCFFSYVIKIDKIFYSGNFTNRIFVFFYLAHKNKQIGKLLNIILLFVVTEWRNRDRRQNLVSDRVVDKTSLKIPNKRYTASYKEKCGKGSVATKNELVVCEREIYTNE